MKRAMTFVLACLLTFGGVIRAGLPAAEAVPIAPRSHATAAPKPQPQPVRFDGTTPAGARRLAQHMVASRGWNRGEQWRCLFRLWQKESGWRHNADNKHSSAYGIPQLLGLAEGTPPAKQIERGLRYVVKRYGTPCEAYAHQQRRGWY